MASPTLVTMTDSARDKVRQLLEKENKQDYALRVGVVGGGCSGYSYNLELDNEVDEEDTVCEFDGVRVLVDGMSARFLIGAEIDYVDGLKGAGFAINNPNAKATCGCGESVQF